jgi:hypothetical protein
MDREVVATIQSLWDAWAGRSSNEYDRERNAFGEVGGEPESATQTECEKGAYRLGSVTELLLPSHLGAGHLRMLDRQSPSRPPPAISTVGESRIFRFEPGVGLFSHHPAWIAMDVPEGERSGGEQPVYAGGAGKAVQGSERRLPGL